MTAIRTIPTRADRNYDPLNQDSRQATATQKITADAINDELVKRIVPGAQQYMDYLFAIIGYQQVLIHSAAHATPSEIKPPPPTPVTTGASTPYPREMTCDPRLIIVKPEEPKPTMLLETSNDMSSNDIEMPPLSALVLDEKPLLAF